MNILGTFPLRVLAALIAGAMQAASLASPWSGAPVWWLQILSLSLFAALLPGVAGAASAFVLAWAFCLAWLCGSFGWLFISMHTYGGLAAPLAGGAVLALAAFLSLYYALGMSLLRVRLPQGAASYAMGFASLWTLGELMRGQWFTGFPWGAIAYAHVDGPLAPLAPWLGAYGVGALAAALAAFLGAVVAGADFGRRAWLGLALCAGLVGAAHWAEPGGVVPHGRPMQVRLLQGNIAQGEKFEPSSGIPLALDWYGAQLVQPGADLVVAPETAIPLLPQQLPKPYWLMLHAGIQGAGHAALMGVPLGDSSQGYTNSVVGVAPGVANYRYDKHHLVPFGEFIPPFFRWFTELMHIPLGDFNRGALVQPPFLWRGQRLAPNICYEDLFGEELAARFADPQQAPTIWVNVSNIAWFGRSLAVDQHLHISRMRALEFARPMVRATNTGATALIDHRGVVQAMAVAHQRGSVQGSVQGMQGLTPYARWAAAWGSAPLWVLGVVFALLALLGGRRAGPRA